MSFSSSTYPYDTVVYITDTIGGAGFQASGVMLSPDEVLTASHVVYTAGVGTATNVKVTPGYNSGSAPYGSAVAAYYHYIPVNDSNDILSAADSQFDYAILHLATPINVGTMGYLANFRGGPVQVTGYPATASGAMTDTTENVTLDPHYSLLEGPDTGRGSSGGPLWIQDANGPEVVGLVSSGNGTTSASVQITSAVYAQIQSWIAQDDYTNPLINAAYYRAHNPDVAAAPINAAYHYESVGWREGRDPNAYFADAGYLAFNKDVANAGINPLDEYAATGWREGRDPAANFDTGLYLLHNPDVAQSGIDPLLHYIDYGMAEGRTAYAAIGPSMSLIGDFDPEYYLLANPDVARSGMDPWTHFATFGWKEDRNPDAFFDTRGYLQANPDVAQSGVDPLLQYEQYGWKEGRNPSATFDTQNYLAAYADVRAAAIDPLQHYLASGAMEGRLTFGDGKFT